MFPTSHHAYIPHICIPTTNRVYIPHVCILHQYPCVYSSCMYSSPVTMCSCMYPLPVKMLMYVCMYSLQVITHNYILMYTFFTSRHGYMFPQHYVLCIPVFAPLMLGISKLPLPGRYIMESITAGYWMCLCRQVLRMSRVQTDESNTFRYWRGNHPSDDVHFD